MNFGLVIPTYNFKTGIAKTFSRIADWRQANASSCEVYFVDDGSTDGTHDALQTLAAGHPQWCHLLSHPANRGKGAAVRTGFEAAKQKHDYVIMVDCDLHYGLDILVERVLPALKDNDVVILDRSWVSQAGHVSGVRRFASGIFNRAVSILTGVNFRDTQAGLKAFRRDRCAPIFAKLRLDGFSFDVELLSLAAHYRLRIKQIPISFEPGVESPHHTTINLFWTPLLMAGDLIKINWHWKRGHYASPDLQQLVDPDIYRIRKADG